MPDHLVSTLRLLAASLVTLLGIGRVASLWFRELDQQAVAALLLGTVYLITGLGLFGQSRFTVLVAIALCTAVAVLTLVNVAVLTPLQQAGVALDLITVALCSVVAWHAHSKASTSP
ncbi:hypothetical protein E2F43_14310 [Seongchinamella unica]|uniref:Uncharacterized protein n=1 Tax=Seongchinamella unica TaxID=2547392 RepID=A0A4R5LQE4_9GAMM|nr:hypothetical protein [Seongchinamella unica]TDG12739.1 hypothetical protein E2F43_14310 [Seongchinamella unica]